MYKSFYVVYALNELQLVLEKKIGWAQIHCLCFDLHISWFKFNKMSLSSRLFIHAILDLYLFSNAASGIQTF